MRISKSLSSLRNKIVYLALLVLFVRLLGVSLVYSLPLLYLLYFLYRRVPSLFIYTGCILVLMLISASIIILKPSSAKAAYVKGDINVADITSFTAVQNGLTFKVYTDQDIDLAPGDKIMIEGEFQEVINPTIPHTFNYKKYLLSKRIKYTVFTEEIDVIGHRFSFQSIRFNIADYIDRNAPLSGHYLKTFILADQSGFEESIKEDIDVLGISHLFAVSGLHIGLLTMAIDRLTKKLFPKISPQKVIIPILFSYMILTSFSPSVVRAGCLYLGIVLNKKYTLELSLLDILSIIFLGYLIVSPYAIYSLGFSLSFLVTFSIILGQYILKDKTNTIQLLLISMIAMLIALPITVNINKEINVLTIIVNVFLIYGMSFVILPVGYMTFIIPFLDPVYYQLIRLYERLIQVMAGINVFRFDFVFVNPILVLIYYVLVLLFFASFGRASLKRQTVILLVFLLLSFNIQRCNPVKSVSMIDIYGDSILIKDSFDRCNILIDTGDIDEYDSVVSYIKGEGIHTIDYLIITHEHADHNGERNDLKTELKVMKEINTRNVDYKDIQCGSIKLTFYPFEKTYRDENNKSLVFSLEVEQKTYLFTGDMEYQKEEEFVSLYDIEVDILKSGHHGSITSSSDLFLDSIEAEEVWVSCYRKNIHKHPHEVIIERYQERNMNVYRTDTMGTITQYFIFGKGYKRLHKP